MSDRERTLFERAREWDPVEPAMLTRVARRLDSRPRRPRLFLPLTAAAAVAAAALFFFRSPPEPVPPPVAIVEMVRTAHAPARAPEREVSVPAQKKPRPSIRIGAAPKRALAPKPTPVPSSAPDPVPEAAGVATPDPVPEAVPEAVPDPRPETHLVVTPPPAELGPRERAVPKPYVPRAIVEFTRVDWARLERHDELPAYVQSIVARRDPNALLAALDRLDVQSELRLVRGELRAGASRCAEAVQDFDAVLHDERAAALHGQAVRARRRCLPAQYPAHPSGHPENRTNPG